MKEVTIIQRILPHYRVPFFNGLRESLQKQDVKLNLIYGSSLDVNSSKRDEVELGWGTKIKNRTFDFFGLVLIYQPCISLLRHSQLIVVEQANKNVINYWLMIARKFDSRKLAFWGHGRNRQTNSKSLTNLFKGLLLRQCSWWFAYTQSVKEYLLENKVKENQITVVQNAIDTKALKKDFDSVTDIEVLAAKKNFNINSENIGIFCGGMYKEKRLPFLLQCCDAIRHSISDFEAIFIGSGPDKGIIEMASMERPWLHYLGPQFGRSKAIFFKMSKVFLMPGLVGLAILDSFAYNTPMFTTRYPFHSPEIEYLQDGHNGFVIENDSRKYSEAVINYLSSQDYQHEIESACEISYHKYTMENMVSNFSEGILQCLNLNNQ